jgi:hypothetical protein
MDSWLTWSPLMGLWATGDTEKVALGNLRDKIQTKYGGCYPLMVDFIYYCKVRTCYFSHRGELGRFLKKIESEIGDG